MPGESFYDDERIRFTGEGLVRVYQLLYPRDKKVITPEVLEIAGIQGLTALWLDYGTIQKTTRRGHLTGPFSRDEYIAIASAYKQAGVTMTRRQVGNFSRVYGLGMDAEQTAELVKLIRPYAHVGMREKLILRRTPQRANESAKPANKTANRLLRRR